MMSAYRQSFFSRCPHCGSELEATEGSLECQECAFVEYDNPAPCVILLIEYQGKLLIGKRAIEPRKDRWDWPGGFAEPHESFEETALREAREETGLDVEILRYLGSVPDLYGEPARPTLCVVYHCRGSSEKVLAQDDIASLEWRTPDELPAAEEWAFPSCRVALDLYTKKAL